MRQLMEKIEGITEELKRMVPGDEEKLPYKTVRDVRKACQGMKVVAQALRVKITEKFKQTK